MHLIRDRANGGHVDDLRSSARDAAGRPGRDRDRRHRGHQPRPYGVRSGPEPLQLQGRTDRRRRAGAWRWSAGRARRCPRPVPGLAWGGAGPADGRLPRSRGARVPGSPAVESILHEQGLPKPDLQVEVYDDRGYFLARSDFGWIERRTLGEFDGQGKYGALRRPGPDVPMTWSWTRRPARTACAITVGRWRAGTGPSCGRRSSCANGSCAPSPEQPAGERCRHSVCCSSTHSPCMQRGVEASRTRASARWGGWVGGQLGRVSWRARPATARRTRRRRRPARPGCPARRSGRRPSPRPRRTPGPG